MSEPREGVTLCICQGGSLSRGISRAQVELQGSEHAHLILSTALQNLAGDFPQFQASDFAYWFQVAFHNVLQTTDEAVVAKIPSAMSCDSYQQM